MNIDIDRRGEAPLYRQIEAWLRKAIGSGHLPAGTRLPASRTLAADLGLSRTTVDAAYAELLADGLLETRGSGGTVVSTPPTESGEGWPAWQDAFGERRGGVSRSQADDVIDFSAGRGDDSLFPLARFMKGLKASGTREGDSPLSRADPAGESGLRAAIARTAASHGLLLPPEGILVTGGAQQAIALAAQALGRRGGTVLVEEPGYATGIALFRTLGLRVVGIPCDAQGPKPEALRIAAAAGDTRFIYLMPNFRNPTGTCIGAARRRAVVETAADLGVPIVEDDYVGELRYEGRPLPSLKTLARPGMVIYTSTFSKLLAPGLCIGFVAADGPILDALDELKSLAGLSCSKLLQRGLERHIGAGDYRNHLRRAVRRYRARRDALCAELERRIPDAAFDRPSGGLFLWLRIPASAETEGLNDRCAEEGVLVENGGRYFVEPDAGSNRFLRLNFARVPVERMGEGVERLGRALMKR